MKGQGKSLQQLGQMWRKIKAERERQKSEDSLLEESDHPDPARLRDSKTLKQK